MFQVPVEGVLPHTRLAGDRRTNFHEPVAVRLDGTHRVVDRRHQFRLLFACALEHVAIPADDTRRRLGPVRVAVTDTIRVVQVEDRKVGIIGADIRQVIARLPGQRWNRRELPPNLAE